jgi:hypothetical protein
MTNENEGGYPAGYYFDDKKDGVTAVPTETPAEVPTESSTEVAAEIPTETKVETVKAPELSPSEVAKQRREGVANFFKNTKTNFKNTVLSVGGGIVKFFGKAKALGGAIVEGGRAIGSEAIDQARTLGNETLDSAKVVGNEALNFVVAPDVYIKKGAENLAVWSRNKAESMSNFAKGKAELVAAVMKIVENETAERVNQIQADIAKRYEDLKQFGNDAIESAAGKIRDVKEGLRNKKNNLIIAFLKSIEGAFRTKADKVAGKIELLQGLKAN